MKAVILSYTNPDLDGVACAIGLADLNGAPWSPHVVGEIDPETRCVLDRLCLAVPPLSPAWTDVDRIWLVDTHHPNQLPADFPCDRVVRITDHHPGGAPDRFPAADIENAPVGAAATLVAEHMVTAGHRIPPAIAKLLQAAILSNTLDFNAPATAQRDRTMFAHLEQIAPLSSDIVAAMARARSARLAMSSAAIVQSDVKTFETALGRVTIGQVECGGALELLSRDDLRASLMHLSGLHMADAAILNLVDLDHGESAVLATNRAIIDRLASRLGATPEQDGTLRLDRLLQRKTDIVLHLG